MNFNQQVVVCKTMINRGLAASVHEALADTPVVLLTGARQSGKSTLAQAIGSSRPHAYVSLDTLSALAAARTDPVGFVEGFTDLAIIDEVQRAPELFLAIKAAVDKDRRPGRFLLTGSANVLLVPRLADTLVGRMEVLTLWPFSQGELNGHPERFVDAVFADDALRITTRSETRESIIDRVLIGGYPEATTRKSVARRDAWFGSYVNTMLQREIPDLAQVDGVAVLNRLITLIAARAPTILNYAAMSRDSGVPQTTLKRYFALLGLTYLTLEVPAWFTNASKRIQKSPKLTLTDTGLMSWLQGATPDRLQRDPTLLGGLLESFVITELRKQIGWSVSQPHLHHLRASSGQEVDIVLEDRRGRLVGIEVKAAAAVGHRDFAGLRYLADTTEDRFHRGIVLYLGEVGVPMGQRMHALPLSSMWSLGG